MSLPARGQPIGPGLGTSLLNRNLFGGFGLDEFVRRAREAPRSQRTTDRLGFAKSPTQVVREDVERFVRGADALGRQTLGAALTAGTAPLEQQNQAMRTAIDVGSDVGPAGGFKAIGVNFPRAIKEGKPGLAAFELGTGLAEFVLPGIKVGAGIAGAAMTATRRLGEPLADAARLAGEVDTGLQGRWFSRASAAIEEGPKSATAAQWRARLGFDEPRGFQTESGLASDASRFRQARATQGVGPDEAEFTGLNEFLDAQSNPNRKFTKAELQQFMDTNGIRLTETVRGERFERFDVEAWWTDEGGANSPTPFDELSPEGQADARALYRIDVAQFDELAPKFEAKTQPGGENYREVLIQLERGADDANEAFSRRFEEIRAAHGVRQGPEFRAVQTPAESAELGELARRADEANQARFTGGHFDEPNVLAHLRMTDRTVDGERTLFIEEMQSDWHKAGRESGYRGDPITESALDVVETEIRGSPAFRIAGPDGEVIGTYTMGRDRAVRRALSEIEQNAGLPGAVPDAPFKGTEWVGLSFRRALQEAVDGGYDRLAWVSGQQSADLYDLRKHVSRIQWEEDAGRLLAWDLDGNRVIHETGITAEKLPDTIGKGPADRLIAQTPALPETVTARNAFQEEMGRAHGMGPRPAQADREARNAWIRSLRERMTPDQLARERGLADAAISDASSRGGVPRNTPARSIEGEDLAIGGEAHIALYDRIVPNIVRKEAKRLGVEIEPVRAVGDELVGPLATGGGPSWGVRRNGEMIATYPTRAEAVATISGPLEGPTNLSIRITPEAREKILRGGLRLGAADIGAVGGAAAIGAAGLGSLGLLANKLKRDEDSPFNVQPRIRR